MKKGGFIILGICIGVGVLVGSIIANNMNIESRVWRIVVHAVFAGAISGLLAMILSKTSLGK